MYSFKCLFVTFPCEFVFATNLTEYVDYDADRDNLRQFANPSLDTPAELIEPSYYGFTDMYSSYEWNADLEQSFMDTNSINGAGNAVDDMNENSPKHSGVKSEAITISSNTYKRKLTKAGGVRGKSKKSQGTNSRLLRAREALREILLKNKQNKGICKNQKHLSYYKVRSFLDSENPCYPGTPIPE